MSLPGSIEGVSTNKSVWLEETIDVPTWWRRGRTNTSLCGSKRRSMLLSGSIEGVSANKSVWL